MKMYKKMAKSISYSPIKRNRKDVKYIVIHYTGNSNDTAKNNADYYATGNTRLAGAHFFVDKLGNTARSIPMNRTAWAVGGAKYADCKATGGGKYYSKCTNYNSVSIVWMYRSRTLFERAGSSSQTINQIHSQILP